MLAMGRRLYWLFLGGIGFPIGALTKPREMAHNNRVIILLVRIIDLRGIKALGFYFFT